MKRLLLTLVIAIAALTTSSIQANAQPGGNFDPAQISKMMADNMKDQLKLNDAQYEKILKYLSEEMKNQKMPDMSGGMPSQEEMETMMADMEKRQQAREKEFKNILTDEQFKAWQKQQEERRQGGGFGGF